MTIGLTGAASTGKSTLANAFVKFSPGFTVVASNASAVFKSMNLPLDRPLTFNERMLVQGAILEDHCFAVREAGAYSISDRTPLDMAIYTLAEWGANCTAEQGVELLKYVERCFNATNRLFSSVTLIQPGIPYEVNAKRPPQNVAAVELFNLLARSLMRDPRLLMPTFIMSRDTTDLTERVALVCNIWNTIVQNSAADMQNSAVH